MKRILYLAPTDIAERSGVAIACYAYYNALKALYPGIVDLAMPAEYCINEYKDAIGVPRRGRLRAILSFSIHRYKSFMRSFLRRNHNEYSLCIINGSVHAGDMMSLFRRYHLKTVVIHHNYEKEYYMDNRSIGTFNGRYGGIITHNEKNAYRKADLNLYLTIPDLNLIRNAYGRSKGRDFVIGVFDPERIEYCTAKGKDLSVVAITGGLRAYQAYKSIAIFEKEYYPLMRERFPELKIIMAGRAPNRLVYEFCAKYPESIELIPSPPEMDPIIDRAAIFLCPTCLGGGLKLHVMDGLRMGLPVLTHKVSARGYEAFHGKPYFQVYESPEEFIEGLGIITGYISNNNAFKQEILDTYRSTFGFEAGVERMKAAMSVLPVED